MKNLILMCLMLSMSGCAHQYVMKLSNGVQISAPNKPRLKGSYYHFKDARGQDQLVPQSRVIEIEPASMAKDENKFKVAEPYKKKHWYWPF